LTSRDQQGHQPPLKGRSFLFSKVRIVKEPVMYYHIRGLVRVKGYLASDEDTTKRVVGSVDTIVNSPTLEMATDKAMYQAALDTAKSCDMVDETVEWIGEPEIREATAEEINRILGPELAPTLPGLE
jgi:hypothetical protein